MSFKRSASSTYRRQRQHQQFVGRTEMMSFRTNFMSNLPGTLKEVQEKLKDGWELMATQANPKSEMESKVKPMVSRGGYESEFVPVKGAEWAEEPYGFMMLRQKASTAASSAPKPTPKSNEPRMPAGFFTDVDQSFKGVRKFKPEDNVLISDDNSVIAGDFSDPPKSGTFRDLVDSYSSSVKSLSPVLFAQPGGQDVADISPHNVGLEIENEFSGDSKAHVVEVESNGVKYDFVAEPVISALRAFPPTTTVRAIVDTNTNPSEPALGIHDGNKFIAIGPITVEDQSVVTARNLGKL